MKSYKEARDEAIELLEILNLLRDEPFIEASAEVIAAFLELPQAFNMYGEIADG